MFSQLRNTTRYPLDCENAISSHISHLLLSRRPSAISRLVISIIVDAVKGQSRRLVPHVLKKVFEFHPPLANRDSPASVIFKRRPLRVRAPLNHVPPAYVSRGLPLSSNLRNLRMSVSGKRFRNEYVMLTSARSSVSCNQTPIPYALCDTAFAFTKTTTQCYSFGNAKRWCIRNDFKASKDSSDQRDFCRHGIGVFNVVFSGGLRRQPDPLRFVTE